MKMKMNHMNHYFYHLPWRLPHCCHCHIILNVLMAFVSNCQQYGWETTCTKADLSESFICIQTTDMYTVCLPVHTKVVKIWFASFWRPSSCPKQERTRVSLRTRHPANWLSWDNHFCPPRRNCTEYEGCIISFV